MIEAHWITPLVDTLVFKHTRVDPADRAIEALRFVLRWLDEPDLDLSAISDETRMAAMLKLATIHVRALRDESTLEPQDAALGRDARRPRAAASQRPRDDRGRLAVNPEHAEIPLPDLSLCATDVGDGRECVHGVPALRAGCAGCTLSR